MAVNSTPHHDPVPPQVLQMRPIWGWVGCGGGSHKCRAVPGGGNAALPGMRGDHSSSLRAKQSPSSGLLPRHWRQSASPRNSTLATVFTLGQRQWQHWSALRTGQFKPLDDGTVRHPSSTSACPKRVEQHSQLLWYEQ